MATLTMVLPCNVLCNKKKDGLVSCARCGRVEEVGNRAIEYGISNCIHPDEKAYVSLPENFTTVVNVLKNMGFYVQHSGGQLILQVDENWDARKSRQVYADKSVILIPLDHPAFTNPELAKERVEMALLSEGVLDPDIYIRSVLRDGPQSLSLPFEKMNLNTKRTFPLLDPQKFDALDFQKEVEQWNNKVRQIIGPRKQDSTSTPDTVEVGEGMKGLVKTTKAVAIVPPPVDGKMEEDEAVTVGRHFVAEEVTYDASAKGEDKWILENLYDPYNELKGISRAVIRLAKHPLACGRFQSEQECPYMVMTRIGTASVSQGALGKPDAKGCAGNEDTLQSSVSKGTNTQDVPEEATDQESSDDVNALEEEGAVDHRKDFHCNTPDSGVEASPPKALDIGPDAEETADESEDAPQMGENLPNDGERCNQSEMIDMVPLIEGNAEFPASGIPAAADEGRNAPYIAKTRKKNGDCILVENVEELKKFLKAKEETISVSGKFTESGEIKAFSKTGTPEWAKEWPTSLLDFEKSNIGEDLLTTLNDAFNKWQEVVHKSPEFWGMDPKSHRFLGSLQDLCDSQNVPRPSIYDLPKIMDGRKHVRYYSYGKYRPCDECETDVKCAMNHLKILKTIKVNLQKCLQTDDPLEQQLEVSMAIRTILDQIEARPEFGSLAELVKAFVKKVRDACTDGPYANPNQCRLCGIHQKKELTGSHRKPRETRRKYYGKAKKKAVIQECLMPLH